ncbi:alpha/beta hydrolase [Laspinema palackyanum]|uniref:alpha/beta hydrolase n=1 Tax=Laspinema palackyanum TaxID=3231601 RepID=UPI00345D5DB6|nr:alpha/beta hydrolase [Laspinema sp. D2c]
MVKMRLSMLSVLRRIIQVGTLGIALLGVGEGMLSPSSANAAEEIILKYGPMRAPVSVADLSRFAETGDLSFSLRSYMRLSSQNPDEVRNHLNRSISLSPRFLDRALNNRLGKRVLDEMGDMIQTPSGQLSGQALRASLVLSAAEDGQISVVELIENYPAQTVEVDVQSLIRVYNKLSFLEKLPF